MKAGSEVVGTFVCRPCASLVAAQSLATLLVLLVSGACQFNLPICGAVVAWFGPSIIFADRYVFANYPRPVGGVEIDPEEPKF